MDEERKLALAARREEMQARIRRAAHLASLSRQLGPLDAAGTPYRLYYPGDPDCPDWPDDPAPPDWAHAAPTVEIVTGNDRAFAARLVGHAIAERVAPGGLILVTPGNGASPQIALAREDFERHIEDVLSIDPFQLWLAAPPARWLIDLCFPRLRITG